MSTTGTPRTSVERAAAEQAAHELRTALASAGFTSAELRNLRGDVTVSNEPFVALGRLSPRAAQRLAEIARTCAAQ